MANINAEKILLSGFIRFPDSFLEYAQHLKEDDFSGVNGYKLIFNCIKSLMLDKESSGLSKAKIIAEARSLGFDNFLSLTKNGIILDELLSESVAINDIPKWFLEVKRQSVLAKYADNISVVNDYLKSTADPLHKIISNVEDQIIGSVSVLDYGQTSIKQLTHGIKDFVFSLAEEPGHMGLDLGLPIWQSRIGQIRNASVTFIASTAKCGKSQLGLKFGLTTAHKLKLPILLIDTELSESDQKIRIVGMLAKIPYDIIETGYWKLSANELRNRGLKEDEIAQIAEYARRLNDQRLWEIANNLPIDYLSVSGLPFEEVLPHIRRWILTKAKPNAASKFPECLIIYDYLKLATIDELKGGKVAEWQIHGINYAALHALAKKYNLPVLCFGQTNNEIDSDIRCIAGAKRIAENVTSVTYLKAKTEEERAMDPNGSHIMKVFVTRHGSGTKLGGYINLDAKLEYGEFIELGLGAVNFAEERSKKVEEWKKNRKKKYHKRDDDEIDDE